MELLYMPHWKAQSIGCFESISSVHIGCGTLEVAAGFFSSCVKLHDSLPQPQLDNVAAEELISDRWAKQQRLVV
jgi:hypothetical protein